MALVAHFDLVLHQMNVKTVFLNGNIDETIYMKQPENFSVGDPKKMVCNSSMDSSRRLVNGIWCFIKWFSHLISRWICLMNAFTTSLMEGNTFFLVLYADDILFASNDISLLRETKNFLSKNKIWEERTWWRLFCIRY